MMMRVELQKEQLKKGGKAGEVAAECHINSTGEEHYETRSKTV